MGSTMAPGPHMGYFSIQPQPYIHDPMGMRYGLPPGLYDPRMQLSGGRHKKVRGALAQYSLLFWWIVWGSEREGRGGKEEQGKKSGGEAFFSFPPT